jgi:hypothetical protein
VLLLLGPFPLVAQLLPPRLHLVPCFGGPRSKQRGVS